MFPECTELAAAVAEDGFGQMANDTQPKHEWRPRRFMVIVAPPDDADFGPAGTAAAWIAAGAQGWLAFSVMTE